MSVTGIVAALLLALSSHVVIPNPAGNFDLLHTCTMGIYTRKHESHRVLADAMELFACLTRRQSRVQVQTR
jgi:hypothetical protein